MSTKITPCPNGVHWVNVSYTTNPVTQVAEVAVNKQFKGEVTVPAFEDMGRVNKIVPTRIINKKLKQIIRTGAIV